MVVDRIVDRGQVVYGVNTGFGNFASVIINDDELEKLQINLVRSHAAGVGDHAPVEVVRMLMALRINVFCKGHSGIRVENVEKMLLALNKNCLPKIPFQGTVGASGDLAPLSHLALGLMGEGEMWDPELKTFFSSQIVLKKYGLEPIVLKAKEGLALINGTQFITSIGVEALVRAKQIAMQADVIAAITIEALHGSVRPFHPLIHQARPHAGQVKVAETLRLLLHSQWSPSEISASHINCKKVQDSYTLRCVPQIHGICHDTIQFVDGILSVECNSGTDNPMIFANTHTDELLKHSNQHDYAHDDENVNSELGLVISGGNFHGEYPAKALDYLAIGVHELASVSERRIERLVNPNLSALPAFLVQNGGVNSGFMISHCTAASLVSENKVLCHPSSVDSLSTSAAQEDHVSMGGFAARKALQVVKNVEYVLAIELLTAVQALDFHPLKTTAPLENVRGLVRSVVKFWDADRYMAPDIEAVAQLLRDNKVWQAVESHIELILKSEITPLNEVFRKN